MLEGQVPESWEASHMGACPTPARTTTARTCPRPAQTVLRLPSLCSDQIQSRGSSCFRNSPRLFPKRHVGTLQCFLLVLTLAHHTAACYAAPAGQMTPPGYATCRSRWTCHCTLCLWAQTRGTQTSHCPPPPRSKLVSPEISASESPSLQAPNPLPLVQWSKVSATGRRGRLGRWCRTSPAPAPSAPVCVKRLLHPERDIHEAKRKRLGQWWAG